MSKILQSAQTRADIATLLEGVVDQVCRDLEGWVPRSRVRHAATELMARYPAPLVTVYMPIILRRLVREQFEVELHQRPNRPRSLLTPGV